MNAKITYKGLKRQQVEANPFPGLRPFGIEESHLFFGREGQSDEVLMKLYDNRFVAVVGPSGSGKSSFIYCGVIPILYGGFVMNKTSSWNIVVSRPGASPIDNLALALAKKESSFQEALEEDQQIKQNIIAALLKSSSFGLIEAVMQIKELANKNTLILIDQFEELFRFRRSEDSEALNESLAFVNLLTEAIRYAGVPIYVAITMRSDFIGECAFFPELTRCINNSYYMIPQMTRDQKRMAVVGPVAVGGGEITPRLVQRLLNDLGDNPDQLPILQHSLMRTWDYWIDHREGEEPLDVHHYEAIGTMSEALSLHANEAYDELSEAQKRLCEITFKAITEKGGESNQGVRRPTKLAEIADIADVRVSDIVPIIEKFRAQGRSLLMPAAGVPLQEDTVVDISHESLMRIWTRLKNWVEDEGEAVQMYQRLSEASAMYQIGKAGLWRPPDLQLALNWKEKHKPTLIWGKRYNPAFERTMVFLEYSRKEYETEQKVKEMIQKRTLKRTRLTALILGFFTIVAIAFLVYAMAKKVEADQQRELADANLLIANEQKRKVEEAQKISEAQRIEAEKQRVEAERQKEYALQQKEEAEKQRKYAEEKTQEAILAKQEAERQREIAKDNEIKAKESEKRAIASELLAKENEQKAVQQEALAKKSEREARNQRLLSVAQSMAVKSLQLDDDPELQAINAQQAYRFHTENGGYEYHTDIYNGLYYAIKNIEGKDFNQLKGHTDKVSAIVASPKGNRVIYSASSDGKIYKWDITLRSAGPEEIASNDYVNKSLAISNNGRYLAAGGNSNKVQVFDLQNISVQNIELPTQVWQLIFPTRSNQGLTILGADNKIYFWDYKELQLIAAPAAKVNAIAVSADGKTIATADAKGQLLLWDNKPEASARVFYSSVTNTQLTAVQFSNRGEYLVAGESNGRIKIWQWQKSEKPINTLLGHRSFISALSFSQDDQRMASGSYDGTARIWNIKELNREPIVLRDHVDWVWTLSFSPDNDQVVVGCKDNVMRLWHTDMRKMGAALCDKTTANMSRVEWERYVPNDIGYEATCPDKQPRIDD